MKTYLSCFVIGLVLGLAFLFTQQASATQLPKVDICHYDGQSGNFQTLHITIPAAQAHLQQHEADYAGACHEVDLTPTPTEEPEVSPTPTEDPVATPSATLTQTPTPESQANQGGDGKGDGRSDGRSSCPACTQAPPIPAGPPKTGHGGA